MRTGEMRAVAQSCGDSPNLSVKSCAETSSDLEVMFHLNDQFY